MGAMDLFLAYKGHVVILQSSNSLAFSGLPIWKTHGNVPSSEGCGCASAFRMEGCSRYVNLVT